MNRFRTCIAALALALAPASLAAAEPFTLLIYETPEELALRTAKGDAGAAYWGGYGAFAAEAGAAGILRGGAALHTGAAHIGTVGPVAARDTGLRISGYFQIDVATMEDATAWAARIPAAASGRVEIVRGYPAPGM